MEKELHNVLTILLLMVVWWKQMVLGNQLKIFWRLNKMRGTKAKMLRRVAIGTVGVIATDYASRVVKIVRIPTGKTNPDGTQEYHAQEQRTTTMIDCTRTWYKKLKSDYKKFLNNETFI
jgi:hypothetical protein